MSATQRHPPGLEDPPPGWVWQHRSVGGSGVWSLQQVDPTGAESAAAQSAKELALHRIAYRQNEERERAERELAATVSGRADDVLRVLPSDRELGCDCESLSAVRATLLRTEKFLTLARSRLMEAEKRATRHNELVAKRDAISADLSALESSVREQFEAYNTYGSATPEPDSRDVERSQLRSLLSSAEWEASLSSNDALMVSVAERVVETLQDRLPGLRSAVLVEEIAPALIERVKVIADQLEAPLSVLCSLGKTTPESSVRASFDDKLVLPTGSSVDISARPDEAATARFKAMLDALAADPLASIISEPTRPKKRWIRS